MKYLLLLPIIVLIGCSMPSTPAEKEAEKIAADKEKPSVTTIDEEAK